MLYPLQAYPEEVKEADIDKLAAVLNDKPSRRDYRINAFDVLEISIYQEPDLNKVVRVSQDGYISFPLVGKVKVAGLDVLKAEEKLAGLLEKDYLVNPSVTIFVKEYCAKKVFVLGEVKNPGAYEISENKGLTVLESIALAGGFSTAASINNTRIIRVENGLKKYIEVRINEITKNGDKTRDVLLEPDDIVLVPERVF